LMSDVRRIVIVTLICAIVLVSVLLLAWPGDAKQAARRASSVRLLVHAGAGIRPPLDEIGDLFYRKTGVRVECNYKGSGCLLADICFAKKGDVYIPGESFYMEQAKGRELINKCFTVAGMSTVIITQKGNPQNIRSVADLARPGLRIGLGEYEATAAGRAAKEVLDRAKVRGQVEKNRVMSALNVIELGNAVKLKHLDAAIVWDATAVLYENGEVATVAIAPALSVFAPIPAGTLKFSKHPKEAARFVGFLSSPEARRIFQRHGYSLPGAAGKGPRKKC